MPTTSDLLRELADRQDRIEHERKGYHESKGFDDTGCVTPSVTPDICGIVDSRNGWIEDGETDEQQAWALAADTLGEVLRFLAQAKTIHSAGLRTFALIFAVRPDLLADSWSNMSEFARDFEISRQSVSKYGGFLAKLAPAFQHGSLHRGVKSRELSRVKAIRTHVKKGHRIHGRKQ